MDHIYVRLICVIIRYVSSQHLLVPGNTDTNAPPQSSNCSIHDLLRGYSDMNHQSTWMMNETDNKQLVCNYTDFMVISDVQQLAPEGEMLCNRSTFLLVLNQCTTYNQCALSKQKFPSLNGMTIGYFCAPAWLYVININVTFGSSRNAERDLTFMRYRHDVGDTGAECNIVPAQSRVIMPLSFKLFVFSFKRISQETLVSIHYSLGNGNVAEINITLDLLREVHLPQDMLNVTMTFRGPGVVLLLLKGIKDSKIDCSPLNEKVTSATHNLTATLTRSTTHGVNLNTSPSMSSESHTFVPPTPAGQETDNKLAVGLGVGITLAVVLIGALTFFLVFFIRRRKANSRDDVYSIPLPNHGQDVSPDVNISNRPGSSDTYHAYPGEYDNQMNDSANRTSHATSFGADSAEVDVGGVEVTANKRGPHDQEYETGNHYAEYDSSGKVDGSQSAERSVANYQEYDSGNGYAEYDDDILGPLSSEIESV